MAVVVLTLGPWIDPLIQRITRNSRLWRLVASRIKTATQSLKFLLRRWAVREIQAARSEEIGSWREVFHAGQIDATKTINRQIPATAMRWSGDGIRGIESTI